MEDDGNAGYAQLFGLTQSINDDDNKFEARSANTYAFRVKLDSGTLDPSTTPSDTQIKWLDKFDAKFIIAGMMPTMELDSANGNYYIHLIWLKDGGELYYMRITPDSSSNKAVSWLMLKDVNTIYEAVWNGSS